MLTHILMADPSSIPPNIPDDEINQMLCNLDTVSSCRDTITVGPFSIFDAQPTSLFANNPNGYLAAQTPVAESMGGEEERFNDSQNEIWCRDEDDVLEAAMNLLQHDDERSRSIILPILDGPFPGNYTTTLDEEPDPCERSISLNTASVIPSREILAKSLHIYSPRSPSPQMDIGGYLLPDRNTSMLMYHYTKHVAELLQPVLHPRNPWRTTYFQFALQGCPDFATCDSSGPALKVSTAIFHSVLSSAAFHLRNATGGSTRFHKLGLRHRAKSLQALNSALLDAWDSRLYTAYLTAMLSLVTIDVSSLRCEFSTPFLTSHGRL